ncbi:MAG: apolipoprotein N-acyltransferase [Coxiellaceae bacterium]|nr:apolipoprotein N-acyltransferase [Coxiellaceae bacterium]
MAEKYSFYAVSVEKNHIYHAIKLIASPFLGAITVFAYAPFNLWPLAILCLVLQLFFFVTSTYKHAFWQGWLYGIGYFALGASWVFISLHRFGGASVFLSVVLTALLILGMGLYYGLAAYIMRRWLHRNFTINCLCAFPTMWVLAEWTRGHWFTGFPWLMLGYTQTTGPLSGYAAILGVYGITLLLCLTAGAITCFLFRLPERSYIWAIVILAAIWLGAIILEDIYWTHPEGSPLQVSIVQGNIPQKDKWNPELAGDIIDTYIRMTKPHLNSQLIVWPEAAVTALPQQAEPLLMPLREQAIAHNSSILYGIPLYDAHLGRYYNGALLMGRNGGTYQKRHLVPFGEFFPMKNAFSWIYDEMAIPLSDLSEGPKQQRLLQTDGIFIAPYICYEIAFPSEVANRLDNANIITVLTDDSWFGDSLASPQHIQMAQMRAEETGRYVIFASNTGPSVLIDAQGTITAEAPQNQQAVLTGEVTPMTGTTPYLISTNHLMGVIISILLLINLLTEIPKSNLAKYQRVEFTLHPMWLANKLKKLRKFLFKF